jgi:hypothetical protein
MSQANVKHHRYQLGHATWNIVILLSTLIAALACIRNAKMMQSTQKALGMYCIRKISYAAKMTCRQGSANSCDAGMLRSAVYMV